MNRDVRLLSSLLLSTWLIDRHTGRVLLGSILNGTAAPEANANPNPLQYVSLQTRAEASAESTTPQAGSFDGGFRAMMAGDSQPNCIAIVTIDYPLYGWYADYLCRQLLSAARDENVVGIILRVNCPGGIDQAAYRLGDLITSLEKPIVALSYYGVMASAAYWIGSACDYVIASRVTDRIGSIGVYIPFVDDRGFYESLGFTIRDVYAPESSEKNQEYRAAQAGDFTLLEQSGSVCAKAFIASVKKSRGKKIKLTAGNPFKGALYYAPDASAIGLIDEIGPLERAVEVVSNLVNGVAVTVTSLPSIDEEDAEDELEEGDASDDPKNPDPDATAPGTAAQLNQSDDMSFFGNPHKKLATLKNREASAITAEEINEANAELVTEGITGAVLVNTDWIAEAEASISALATAKTDLNNLTTERDGLKAKVEEYGGQPGAMGSKSAKTEEAVPGEVTTSDDDKYLSETDVELKNREFKRSK